MCIIEERLGKAFDEARYVAEFYSRRSGGCDASISSISKGLHSSGQGREG
jgi:hypothetical protein